MANWDKRFLDSAAFFAEWSKDRKRKIGAVIVSGRRIISTGFNGIPAGCDDNIEVRHVKPAKLLYFEHAERNAIYAAAKAGVSPEGCTMYLTWFPCADCARGIISVGIKKVVCYAPNWNDDTWGSTFLASKEMLEEAGVLIQYEGQVE